jgi:hypothetical protein
VLLLLLLLLKMLSLQLPLQQHKLSLPTKLLQ